MKPKFTDKEYLEILKVRERLAKVRDGKYGYPEEIGESPKEVTPEPAWTPKQWDVVTQLRADQINLRKTLYDTLKEIKERAIAKRKPKTYKYKDNNKEERGVLGGETQANNLRNLPDR